jgi:hypothetical protein
MSAQLRALVIGMLGPALQASGVTWDLLEHGVLARSEIGHLTFEHIISGPAHLMMATGLAVSIICIPLALQVAVAGRDELEAPIHESDEPDLPLEPVVAPNTVEVRRPC